MTPTREELDAAQTELAAMRRIAERANDDAIRAEDDNERLRAQLAQLTEDDD